MTILLSVLCILLALIAFTLSYFWTERWNKCISAGLALSMLSLLIAAAPTVIPK